MKGGPKMKKLDKSVQITLIIVTAFVVVSFAGFLGFKSLVTPTNTVTGQATIDVLPDLVTVYFTIQTEADTSEEATSDNAKIVEDLTIALLLEGFERNEIQTQGFNVYPNYEWDGETNTQNGYMATHSIKVELSTEDSEKIGSIIDAGIGAGAGISSINFELSQEKQNEYKAQALELAAEDAKIKAQAIVDGLEKQLGKLVSISDNNFGYNPWIMYSGSGAVEEAAVARDAATAIQPSEQKIYATVTAIYRIK